MKPAERRDEIADYIMKVGQARIDDLAERFGVSRMTIHRHVDRLARQGMLRKLHGLVTAQPTGLYESAFRYRSGVAREAKAALAEAALALLEPGQAVMLDDSSTAAALAERLPEVAPLTVLTNSLVSADRLAEAEEIDLIGLGGRYHRTYRAFIGSTCESAIQRYRTDVLFLSASAVDGTLAFVQDAEVTRTKQAMMAAARRKVLLVDAAKFGRVALNVMADLAAFDDVLVAGPLGEPHRRALEAAAIPFRVVAAAVPLRAAPET